MEQNIIDRADEIVKEIIDKHSLSWSFKSIDYVLNDVGVSFDDLQTPDKNNKHLLLLIQSGISSHSKDKAYEIMEEIREAGISPKIAHNSFVEVLKKRHFFTDTQEETEKWVYGLLKLQEIFQNSSLRAVIESEDLSQVRQLLQR